MWKTYSHRRPIPTWIVVAERACVRIFATSNSDVSDLTEIQTLLNPEGACQPGEVETDRPGTFVGPAGSHGFGEPRTDFRHQMCNEVALQITKALEHGRTQNQFGQLIVIAPDLLLGTIRKHLPRPTKELIVAELDKNLSQLTVPELKAYVSQLLVAEQTEEP